MIPERWAIWGSSGHAKVLASAIRLSGGQVVALFDNDPTAVPVVDGVALFLGSAGFRRWAAECPETESIRGGVAIGGARGSDRLAILDLFAGAGLKTPYLIHPSASVCPTARIGDGSQVLALSLVAADAVVGRGCILNHRSAVDHECEIGDGVHLAPGAVLCGLVRVGDGAMIGAGATVLPRVSVSPGAIIGAGAVVTRDVGPDHVVAGVPAKRI